MSEIKAGMVVVLRTTSEPVFVLEIKKTEGLFTAQAKVRRPISGRNGILHSEEWFFVEELETEVEAKTRKFHDIMSLEALSGAEAEIMAEEISASPTVN